MDSFSSSELRATWLNYPLKCHAHWVPWITAVKDYALANSVWKYADPDLSTPATTPQEPIKPLLSDAIKNPSNTFTSEEPKLVDLTSDQLAIYKILLSEYESLRSDYLRYHRAIESLKQGIRSSLTLEGRQIINGLSAYEAIIKLKATFALSDQSKNRQILRNWDTMKRQILPTKSFQLPTWGQKWIIIQSEGEKAGIAYFQDPLSPVYDFLEAVQPSDQGFYTFWYNTILQGLKQPTLIELVNQFVDQHRPTISSGKRPLAYPTFQGHQPDEGSDEEPLTQEPSNPPTQPNRTRKCPCGGAPDDGNHDFKKCRYVNPKARPKGWQPDEKTMELFKKRCESSPGFKAAYQRALKRFQPNNQQSDSQSDGQSDKPPTRDRDAFTTYIPKQQAETLFRDDDGLAMSTIRIDAKKNDTWCYDTGASIHVTNNRSLLQNYRPVMSSVMVGNTETTILGYGELRVTPTKSLDGTTFPLKQVAYCPGFHINLISAERATNAGIYLNGKNCTLEDQDGTPICKLNAKSGIYLIRWDDSTTNQPTANHAVISPISQSPLADGFSKMALSSHTKKQLDGTVDQWHRRLGHISKDILSHLPNHSSNVTVKDLSSPISHCEICKLANIPRQISRLPMQYNRPFESLHWDLIHFEPSLVKTSYLSHSVDPITKYQLAEDLSTKTDSSQSLCDQIDFIKKQFDLDVLTIHSDDEKSLSDFFSHEAKTRGINLETTPPYQPDQNGYAERYGALISKMARQMTIDSGLPSYLWPEAAKTAIYIQNRIPHRSIGWQSPHEALATYLGENAPHWLQAKPDLSNMRIFGCKAYIRINKLPRLAKLAPRAAIGYLVGYEAYNIWRIWIPTKRRVIRARDVQFNEEEFYNPSSINQHIRIYDDANPSQHIAILDEEETSRILEDIDIPYTTTANQSDSTDSTVQQDLGGGGNTIANFDPATPSDPQDLDEILGDQPITPPLEPKLDDSDNSMSESNQSEPEDNTPFVLIDNTNFDPSGYEPLNLPTKRPRSDSDSSREDTKRPHLSFNTYIQAFSTYQVKQPKTLISSIPPAPSGYNQLSSHPFESQFRQAMRVEFNKLLDMHAFEPINAEFVRHTHRTNCQALSQSDCPRHQFIPMRWVYAYKSDESGYLTRFKARLCVRGDTQVPDNQDARTSTLAARTFRTLMAITTEFDLETFQMDAVNAFLNSELHEEVYCQYPPGMRRNSMVLRLYKALYGLRIAGKRWEDDVKEILLSLGFRPCPDDLALYTDNRMVIMIFVDDFLAAYHKSESLHAQQIKKLLSQRFEMKDCGELNQFIGIRIVRNRQQRKTWISQAAYIEKIAAKFHLLDRKPPKTPLLSNHKLDPDLTGLIDPKTIKLYQRKCGSTLFPAVWTRPDTAFTNQLLAQSLTRCNETHLKAADHLISYLYGTRDLAICFGGSQLDNQIFTAASDASFADNSDRKSSEGFIFCLYGGPIEWKSRKQKTITTSTTEAELLAISHAAKQLYWIKRLFSFIQFKTDQKEVLNCDNKQTVDLLVREKSVFQTKLRHVDIHQLWIRQEVQAKRLLIKWVKTTDMPADGLTKRLPADKHVTFIKQLGMELSPSC